MHDPAGVTSWVSMVPVSSFPRHGNCLTLCENLMVPQTGTKDPTWSPSNLAEQGRMERDKSWVVNIFNFAYHYCILHCVKDLIPLLPLIGLQLWEGAAFLGSSSMLFWLPGWSSGGSVWSVSMANVDHTIRSHLCHPSVSRIITRVQTVWSITARDADNTDPQMDHKKMILFNILTLLHYVK